jgi:hypothetical protein
MRINITVTDGIAVEAQKSPTERFHEPRQFYRQIHYLGGDAREKPWIKHL